MRTTLIAGNWKLHNTIPESLELVRALKAALAGAHDAEVAVAPPFTALSAVKEALSASSIRLAAQNVYWEDRGAYTGEVSAPLLADLGCRYCIVGHSERRQYFGETDETVAKRVSALLGASIAPILCIGEHLGDREAGKTLDVVLGQLDGGLAGPTESRRSADELASLVVAYEPVWAIGTGRTASPEDAQEVHAAIRERLATSFGAGFADGCRLLYGGSVKPDNATALLSQPDIDGALVGGASLQADSFSAIVAAAG